jgi:hypothetical protein
MAMAAPRRRRRSRKAVLLSLAAVALMGAGATVEIVTVRAGPAERTREAAAGSTTGPPSTSPRAPAGAGADGAPVQSGCAVAYRVRTMWNAGFTADVRLTNTGNVGVSDWTLTFALTGNQHVLQGWNGVFGQAGRDVTVADAGYNAKLLPGRSTTVGFNGSYRQRNPAPVQFRLNGTPCSLSTT